ncbi:CoA ester lyase [Glutamicibacter sp. JL.03c]|uniref:HpcH/HpaI aldolase/citrate lyase family protein n=1 Tax=Glutamicibacter sp. JL.03c TaxID=2984842 RepID=UPI0021F76530|nr:CoA ester lyase [Glutamicibacter sp. JL.03c]UYQ77414.1 CoA ester lyase [Glutamicibacter sp. JL.03c]
MNEFMMGPAILFCPGDRPERFAKAADRADAVIIDLEDAVAQDQKEAARRALRESELHPARTIVRVNPVDSVHFAEDFNALKGTTYSTVMLPKAQSPEDCAQLADYSVVALCETAAGVANAAQIAAAPNVVALMWGAEDLIASLGGTSSRHGDGSYRQVARFARSHVLIHAAAQGKAAIDSVYLDIPDTDGLFLEAQDAKASGFAAKASIHPSQMQIIRRAYAPTAAEVELAERVLDEAKRHPGVFSLDGKMVDEPLLRQARATLARAAKLG